MGTYVDQPVSTDMIRWVAERVLDMHGKPVAEEPITGRCAQCPPEGSCGLLHWALQALVAAEPVDPYGERAKRGA